MENEPQFKIETIGDIIGVYKSLAANQFWIFTNPITKLWENYGLILGLMVGSLWQDHKAFQTKTIKKAASINISLCRGRSIRRSTCRFSQSINRAIFECYYQ